MKTVRTLIQMIVAWQVDDGERSYPSPPSIQINLHLLTDTEFLAALEQIKEYRDKLQEQINNA